MSACGLDFGTSNTTLGLAGANPHLVRLEGEDVTIPSAVFYSRDAAPLVGRAAITAYVEGRDGRLMRSLKSVLGSSLIDETTQVGRSRVGFRSVIAHFVAVMKRRAEAAAGRPLGSVVHGRPVHFVDGDEAADRKAEAALRAIAEEAGFGEVSFQFEPIAAALDYERQVSHEEIALIADIGGGTSDFSIVRIGPARRGRTDRAGDILANDGIRVGGTDFDRALSLGTVMPLLGYRDLMRRAGLPVPSGYYFDLATWSSINRLYEPGVLQQLHEVRREARRPEKIERLIHVVEERGGHRLAIDVEGAKIDLSAEEAIRLELDWIEATLAVAITRSELHEHTENLAVRIGARIDDCLRDAGLTAGAVDAVFLTGGSTRLSHVRAAILAKAPDARVVEGDIFGSVGMGLTIEAANRYGDLAA